MAEGDLSDWDAEAEAGSGVFTTASDAQLTERLRADTPISYPALRELRTRHRAAVLGYARLCTVDESAGRQMTAQAFALAAQQTQRGVEPPGPWRHQLLLLTGSVAASWAADHRAARLDPGLLVRLSGAGPDGAVPPAPGRPVPPMLAAFHALPHRVQGLVWYGIVDEEPDQRTARFLGLTREDATYDKEPAFKALRHSVLRSRLARSDDPECQDFQRLIEEAVRPDNPRYSADLHAHMAHCVHCATAYEELSALRDRRRATLAEGLLIWGGGAYVGGGSAYVTGDTARVTGGAAVPPSAVGRTAGSAHGHGHGDGRGDGRGHGAWRPSRRFALASAALGVALAPLLVLLLPDGSEPAHTANAVPTATPTPAVTVTATVSPSPGPTSRSPKPTKSSKPSTSPSKSASPSPSRTVFRPPSTSYAQVVNLGSGRCLDIRDGDLEKGTDVVTAPCTSSRTQLWRVDSGRGVVQSGADSDLCLDNRGSTDKGVGIWECDSVDGEHGDNLTFTVDDDGVIRPAIAIETAVTPDGSEGVSLVPLRGSTDQRWRAGKSP